MQTLRRELMAHVGDNPSITQRLLVERAVRLWLQLDLLDQKLTSGTWTDHDGRVFGGAQNAFRLVIRELGIKRTAASPPNLSELLASGADIEA